MLLFSGKSMFGSQANPPLPSRFTPYSEASSANCVLDPPNSPASRASSLDYRHECAGQWSDSPSCFRPISGYCPGFNSVHSNVTQDFASRPQNPSSQEMIDYLHKAFPKSSVCPHGNKIPDAPKDMEAVPCALCLQTMLQDAKFQPFSSVSFNSSQGPHVKFNEQKPEHRTCLAKPKFPAPPLKIADNLKFPHHLPALELIRPQTVSSQDPSKIKIPMANAKTMPMMKLIPSMNSPEKDTSAKTPGPLSAGDTPQDNGCGARKQEEVRNKHVLGQTSDKFRSAGDSPFKPFECCKSGTAASISLAKQRQMPMSDPARYQQTAPVHVVTNLHNSKFTNHSQAGSRAGNAKQEAKSLKDMKGCCGGRTADNAGGIDINFLYRFAENGYLDPAFLARFAGGNNFNVNGNIKEHDCSAPSGQIDALEVRNRTQLFVSLTEKNRNFFIGEGDGQRSGVHFKTTKMPISTQDSQVSPVSIIFF